jgi:cephalosporin hydroxylase
MKNKNAVAVQNLIRLLPLETLKDEEIVLNLIRAFGIVQWGTPVFGEDEQWKNTSGDMAGIYQTPGQLAKALIYLSQFKIQSYCEVGVFQGGNFLFVSEYLKRFNPDIQCTGVDPSDYLNPEIRSMIEQSGFMKFFAGTSETIGNENSFDLVFLDGDHSDEWITKDYNNLGKQAKICMMHDIQETSCPDVVAFWERLKSTVKKKIVKEFLEHKASVPLQGIGIIHGKGAE